VFWRFIDMGYIHGWFCVLRFGIVG
jgi:hypothetical protein